MNFDYELFFKALGLAFVLEGFFWLLFPGAMRQVMYRALQMDSSELQKSGILGICLGLVVIWLATL
ncbi:MAG: DUF2065 domain-containing protein [Desulfovibrio sp.]|nr:DUF2065 domain-containing protein [Desulfovibrio sp.]